MASYIREMSLDGTELVNFLLRIVRGEEARCKTSDRLEAVRILLDRGWGRVPLINTDPLPPGAQVTMGALATVSLDDLEMVIAMGVKFHGDQPPGAREATSTPRNGAGARDSVGHLARYQFRPGQSGNPSGRPKTQGLAQLIRDQTGNGADLVAFLVSVVAGNEPRARVADRIQAARLLIEGAGAGCRRR